MNIAQYNLAFVDTETTGLDPRKHEILEVAVKVCDPQTLEVLSQYQAKVKPVRIACAEPEALAVNGYTEEAWEGALPLHLVMAEVARVAEDCVMAGQKTAFDLAFLEAACAEVGQTPTWRRRRYVDLMTLTYLKVGGVVPKLSLEHACGAAGVSNEGAHTAMADVDRTLACWKALRTPKPVTTDLFYPHPRP